MLFCSKKNIHIKVAILLFFIIISNDSFAFDHNKKIALAKNYKDFAILGDVDYRNNENGLFYRHYELGLRKNFKDNLSISFEYRTIYNKMDNQWDLFEQRPQLQIDKSIDFDLVNFSVMAMQEYRIFDGDDVFRSRLRLRLSSTKSFLTIKPFVTNEFFYDFKINRYNRNRNDIGFEFLGNKVVTPSIAYRYNNDYDEVSHNWHDNYSILFNLIFRM